MPIIQINILEGRSDALKRKLIAEVTDAVSRTLGNPPDTIRVLLYDVPKSHWAVGGKSMAEREEEAQLVQRMREDESVDIEDAVSVDDPGPGV